MPDGIVSLPSTVPVFPLPGMVLFPRTIIPLHLFEPRYRAMMADALATSRMLALAMLRPGWEPLYYTLRAPIHTIVGVGDIVEYEQLDDGNYNLLLRGLSRAVITEELEGRPYRLARIEPLPTHCDAADEDVRYLRRELFTAVRGNPALDESIRERVLSLRDEPVDLDELTDVLAVGMPAEPELRQCLLDEPDAYERTKIVIEQLRTLAAIAHNRRQSADPDHAKFN